MADYLELMARAAEAAGVQPPAMVLPEDRYVSLNGIRFHYLDWGNEDRPHVVLLHGGSLTAHTWDMAALLLRERYHLVALDQRGHGDTEWTPEAELDKDSFDLMLEDTQQFIEHLAYERLVLVGMSMGAMNAARYAARHPERLQALVIVDQGPEMLREGLIEMEQFRTETETLTSFEAFLERAMHFMPHRAPEHLRYSLTHSLKRLPDGNWTWKQDHRGRASRPPMNEADERAWREQRADALWADYRRIDVPTLLMRGEQSKILGQEHAEELGSSMQDARLVVIPRATHNVHSDNPSDFAKELDAFLQERLPTR